MNFKDIDFKSTVKIKRVKFDYRLIADRPKYLIEIIGGKKFLTDDFISESSLCFDSLIMYSEFFEGEISVKQNSNFFEVMKEIQEKYPEFLV